jgi:hypothetical protein
LNRIEFKDKREMSLLNIIKLSPNDTKSASSTTTTSNSLPILTTFPLSSLKTHSSITQLSHQDAIVKDELPIDNHVKTEPIVNTPSDKSKTNCVTVTVSNTANDFSLKIDLFINNVVCTYSTKCHLNLRRIATQGMHVEFKKECGVSSQATLKCVLD